MSLKKTLAKLTSVGLIFFSSYQTSLSLWALFFVYPQLSLQNREAIFLQRGLIERAIFLYLTVVFSGLFGVILFFKPEEKINAFHILFGLALFITSAFFFIPTPFNQDPLVKLLNQLIFYGKLNQ